ncbi:MAG: HAMP domain-containing histidine kinase [Megasphaera sp.]|jgi:K+-sensing histidine kinase KdpD|nr:HAMP domain-containing histidine kinase [Megasphaera sp.]MCI1247579.1 HAMP domain-containing histidine kinase [Megasphaera sp.]
MNIIKRLRRKFIILATAAVVIIVVGALGLINAISYVRMESQCMNVLSYISENGGNIPTHATPPNTSWLGNGSWSDDTPEFSYQIRYFSVLVNSEGYAKQINIKNIAAFSEQEAIQYARTTVTEGKPQGFFKKNKASYGYMITKNDDGTYLIVIMDCTRDVAAITDFMRDSAWFGLICIILYILILAALCNIAIKPFIHNMENQKRFITNAGHELKTPIAIISANAETIEMINGKSQWTESILKQVRRLNNLIMDLITLSKMGERTQADLNMVQVDVSGTVQAVVDSFQPMVKDESKTLTSQVQTGIHWLSDSKCLYELVNILVDNAVKYCDDAGTIAVTLKAGKKNKGAVITVANNYADGKNVDYSRFFERFYRGDESHNSQKSGYGIGLSMAEELTQLLKGKISVNFKDGIITFMIKLS